MAFDGENGWRSVAVVEEKKPLVFRRDTHVHRDDRYLGRVLSGEMVRDRQKLLGLTNEEKERLLLVTDTGFSGEKDYKKESYYGLIEQQGIDIEIVRRELRERGIEPAKVTIGCALSIKDNESDQLRGNLSLASVAAMIDLGFDVSLSVFPDSDPAFVEKLERIKSSGDNRLKIAFYKDKGVSDARRMAYKISSQDCLVFESQELEKLAILPQLPKYFQDVYRGNVGLAMVNRGDLKEAGYPFEQVLGENVQNTLIDNFLVMAGLRDRPVGVSSWDYLIGQRAWSMRETVLADGYRLRPSDLVLAKFKYVDGYGEEDRGYKKESHGEGVYMNVVLAMILGVGVADEKLDYKHDQRQRQIEEFKPVWAEKRIGHATSIPDQIFDVVANYVEDRRGFVVRVKRFLEEGEPIELKHYDMRKWTVGVDGLKRKKEELVWEIGDHREMSWASV